MFWMRNKENSYPIHKLIWRPVEWALAGDSLEALRLSMSKTL